MSLAGHLWTIGPRLRHGVAPLAAPPARPWRLEVGRDQHGAIHVSGLLSEAPEADTLLLVVAGLGGSSASHYALRAAGAAAAAGLSCLRLDQRGCDRRGDDFYHAGLTADLHATLASPELAGYARLLIAGYSLGGHVVLRLATEALDPRVPAVAAVCAPLDLGLSQAAIDRPEVWVYRRYVMRSLQGIYAAVAERRPVPVPLAEARKIAHIREWDERIVAARWGFDGAAGYYRDASVAERLDRLTLPALLVASTGDPMVPAGSLETVLARTSSPLEVTWTHAGGHVAFPPDLDLGLGGPPGLEAQVLGWLGRQEERRAR